MIFYLSLGAPARFGKATQAIFTVLSNDYPNGIFEFPESSRSFSISEDFDPGMENSTEVQLTIVRRMGAFGTAQVWISYQLLRLDRFWILLLKCFLI